MANLARIIPANSVGSFVAFGLLSAVVLSLNLIYSGPTADIWRYVLPNIVFYTLIGIAIHRSRALSNSRIVLYIVVMVVGSGLLPGLTYQAMIPPLLAHQAKPRVIYGIFTRLSWLDSALIAVTTLAFFRGRSSLVLVAAIMPTPLANGIFSCAAAAPQLVGFHMPNIKTLSLISIFASATLHAGALWVVVTNAGQPIDQGFMSITLKRAPKLHWLWVVVLTLFSGGAFAGLWTIVQACWAKGMDGKTTALRSCLGSAVVVVIVFTLITLVQFLQQGAIRSALLLVIYLLLILGAVAHWFGVFAIATVVEGHSRAVHSAELRLNRLWVFLVAAPYLQFHLSRLAAAEQKTDPLVAVFA